MTTQAMETRNETAVSPEARRVPDAVRIPAVDICESDAELRLAVNLPGVEQNGAAVTVEGDVLCVEAEARFENPAGYERVHCEFEPARFRREFTLSDRVRTDGIRARLAHGVLELSVPKAEEVRTRKIAITS